MIAQNSLERTFEMGEAVIHARYTPERREEAKLRQIRHAFEQEYTGIKLRERQVRKRLALRILALRKVAQRRGAALGCRLALERGAQNLLTAAEYLEQARQQVENFAVELCLNLTREVLEEFAQEDCRFMEKRVQRALRSLPSRPVLEVAAQKDDLAALKSLLAGSKDFERAVFTEEPSTTRGDVTLRTEAGCIHLDWRLQLEQLYELVRYRRKLSGSDIRLG